MKLDELQVLVKIHAKNAPKVSYDDLRKLRVEGERLAANEFNENRKAFQEQKNFLRSGILPRYKNCTVSNYIASSPGQDIAKVFCSGFISGFDVNAGQGFIFAGDTGTGKNHLSAAICNKLMNLGYSCLLITVSEMMVELRSCYGENPTMKESIFIKKMLNFDLLVIDEVGLQRNTVSEKITLNMVIDGRNARLKPTGILTNCRSEELKEVLGKRIMRRMNDGSEWVSFNWESYKA